MYPQQVDICFVITCFFFQKEKQSDSARGFHFLINLIFFSFYFVYGIRITDDDKPSFTTIKLDFMLFFHNWFATLYCKITLFGHAIHKYFPLRYRNFTSIWTDRRNIVYKTEQQIFVIFTTIQISKNLTLYRFPFRKNQSRTDSNFSVYLRL